MGSLSTKMGNWLYHTGNAVEASLYGLHKTSLPLNGFEQVFWSNLPDGSLSRQKPALLLVHGFSASHAVWLRFARFFTQDYHVIIPDIAGHGETGFAKTDCYSIDRQSERLCFLLDALNIEQAHISGNSMGGFIAAHMARYHSQHCLSAILIDPAGVSSPQPSAMLKLLQKGDNPFFISTQADFARFYSMVMAKPPYMPGIVLNAICQQYKQRKSELAKVFADYNRPEDFLDNELAEITCPSLLLWGAQDQLIDVSSTAVWQQGLKCESIIWDDLGHMPMLEAPKRCAKAVNQFLESLAKHSSQD